MSRSDVWVLRAFAGWSTFVWLVLLDNMLFHSADRSWGFRGVHLVLAAVSLVLAALTFAVAHRASRRPTATARTGGGVAGRAEREAASR